MPQFRKANKLGGRAHPQIEQIPSSSYGDADAALDAGVQLEEKAERFAVGDKALKYYNLALDLYQRALFLLQQPVAMHADGPSIADAAYNAARVLYVIATSFTLPPKSLSLLHNAIQLYRLALLHTPSVSSTDRLPSASFIDIQFNLGVALLAQSEHVEIVSADDSQPFSMAHDALKCFESVLEAQQTVLQFQRKQEQESTNEDVERPPLPPDDDAERDFSASEYSSSLVTPASALESIYYLHSCILSLLDWAQDEQVLSIFQQGSKYLEQAKLLNATYPDGDKRSPGNEWNESMSQLRYASLRLRINVISRLKQSNSAEFEGLIEEARTETDLLQQQASEPVDISSTNGRSLHKIRLHHLEELGDLLLTLGRCPIDNADSLPTLHANGLSNIWLLLTLSSKLFLAAISSMDKSGQGSASLVLGGSGPGVNPSARLRCSLYTNLSVNSIVRRNTALAMQQTGTEIVGINSGTMRTLIDNGRVYARKALAEAGLIGLVQGNSNPYHIPQGGLDSLQDQVSAVLALLRALSVRVGSSEDEIASSASQEAHQLFTNLIQSGMISPLNDLEQESIGSTWKKCLGFHTMEPLDGRRLCDRATGEDRNPFVTPTEAAFWARAEKTLFGL